MKNIELFNKGTNELGFALSPDQIDQFSTYYELLIEWNKKFNLTAIIDEKDVIIKHFLDSLAIGQVCDLEDFSQLIDMGTGAGFPGIPLKIVYPELEITLVDSLNKRISFLEHVKDELNFEKLQCIHSRAEDLGRNENYREKFDICVSRAVANLSVLSEYCIPFVKKGGCFIPYKSSNSVDEINQSKGAVELLGGNMKSVKEVSIPYTDIKRIFVVITKEKVTSNKYPRKAGKPVKNPLS